MSADFMRMLVAGIIHAEDLPGQRLHQHMKKCVVAEFMV